MVETKWYYSPTLEHSKYVLAYLERKGYKNKVRFKPSAHCCFRGCKDGSIDWSGYRPSSAIILEIQTIYELWT